MAGDRIENGHGQFSLVQAHGQRRAPAVDQTHFKLWLRVGYCARSPVSSKQIEAVHLRPDCFGGEG